MKIEKKARHWGNILKNFALGIAIFILTLFVTIYGIHTLFEQPEHEDFCGRNLYAIASETECINAGGIWEKNYNQEQSPKIPTQEGYCREQPSCYDTFDKANEKYQKKVFIISISLAILIIALGAFIFHLNPVGIGLMFGGIGTLIYGAGGYWRYSDNVYKFLISLIGLIVLIFLAYWFNKKGK